MVSRVIRQVALVGTGASILALLMVFDFILLLTTVCMLGAGNMVCAGVMFSFNPPSTLCIY